MKSLARMCWVSGGILLVLFLRNSDPEAPTQDSDGNKRLRRPNSLALFAPKAYISSKGEHYYIKSGGMWNGTTLVCPHPGSPQDDSFLTLPDFFSLEGEWKDARNIMLVETSCKSRPTYRAWCAVESMAQQNPEAKVWYVMTAPAVEARDGLPPRLLQQYTNLRVVTTDLQRVFSNTPLMPLYTSRAWNMNTEWPVVNLSDMTRLALVWRVGGFYSDTDVVCISSLAALRNVVGFQSDNDINSAVFHFDRHHDITNLFMTRLSRSFNGSIWGKNGPMLFTQVMKEVCGKPRLTPGDYCGGVSLLSWKAFYPILPGKWQFAFLPFKRSINFAEVFSDSYVIHMWNKLSHLQPIFKESGSIYDVAAKTFCPITRAVATAHSSLY